MASRNTTNSTKKPDAHPCFFDLEERIAPLAFLEGHYTNISILKPVIYVERVWEDIKKKELTAMKNLNTLEPDKLKYKVEEEKRTEKRESKRKEFYRINMSFTLEVQIIDFDEKPRLRSKFFDAISLRYLFRDGEMKEVLPTSDGVMEYRVQESNANMVESTAGISGSANGVVPSLQVHLQSQHTIDVDRLAKSWHKGVADEPYSPKADYSVHHSHESFVEAISPPPRKLFFFKVPGKDGRPRHLRCHPRAWQEKYRFATHWSWQTERVAREWAPEIYQSVSFPITVARLIPVNNVRKDQYPQLLDEDDVSFHFEAEVRLRELGHGFHIFKDPSSPPDVRVKKDPGKPLQGDLWGFCIACSSEDIDWPPEPTLDLRAMAALVYKEKAATGEKHVALPPYEVLEEMVKFEKMKFGLEQKRMEAEEKKLNRYLEQPNSPTDHGLHDDDYCEQLLDCSLHPHHSMCCLHHHHHHHHPQTYCVQRCADCCCHHQELVSSRHENMSSPGLEVSITRERAHPCNQPLHSHSGGNCVCVGQPSQHDCGRQPSHSQPSLERAVPHRYSNPRPGQDQQYNRDRNRRIRADLASLPNRFHSNEAQDHSSPQKTGYVLVNRERRPREPRALIIDLTKGTARYESPNLASAREEPLRRRYSTSSIRQNLR